MAVLRSALASLTDLRSSADMRVLATGPVASAELQSGQRLAKPGLSGFSSNSSEQTAQTLMGKGILPSSYRGCVSRFSFGERRRFDRAALGGVCWWRRRW